MALKNLAGAAFPYFPKFTGFTKCQSSAQLIALFQEEGQALPFMLAIEGIYIDT